MFDTITNEWSDLPDAPGQGRKDISAYGGFSETHIVAASANGGAFFEATTGQWFHLPPLDRDESELVNRRVASVRDAIVVVGGERWGSEDGELLTDAYI